MQQQRGLSFVLGAISTLILTFLVCAPAVAMVHAGDELQVTVYNHPELSRKVTVDASSALSLPLVGTINVRGLEPAQISARVASALGAYVRNAAVDIELVAQSESIFVSGGPGGVLKYLPGETLAGGLADLSTVMSGSTGLNANPAKGTDLAGLERSRIDLRRVAVRRDGVVLGSYDAIALSARGDSGPSLVPGDTIVLVNKPNAVRVLGDVARPGMTFVSGDETLADAIDQAGGVTANAASTHLELQRNDKTQLLALGDLQMHQPAQDGDVLVVPTAPRVSVVGMVDKPGPVVLKTDFSLLDALYSAGGPTKWGDLSKVTVIQNGTSHIYNIAALTHGDTSQNPALTDGDTVFVPEGHRVDYGGVFAALAPLLYLVRPF